MSRTLVSFLGRGPYRPDGSRGDYRPTRYAFASDTGEVLWISQPQKHFAYAAFQACHEIPRRRLFDEVVILGTSGSMWDALVDSFGAMRGVELSEEIFHLSDLVDRNQVSQGVLDRFSKVLSDGDRLKIRLSLITTATDPLSQGSILSEIESSVNAGDEVVLDVTHGLRHLPMIGLAAASLITSHKSARIDDIAYGALELTVDGVTPVISLRWIVKLFSAIGGMSEMSRRQNMRPLMECFPSGILRNLMEDAAYKLNVMRIDEASLAARKCVEQLDRCVNNLPPELALIAGVLRDRLLRFTKHSRSLLGLTQMAKLALEEDDFLRTAIYLAEAADIAIAKGVPGDDDEDRRLKLVRNWLAHAGRLQVSAEDRAVKTQIASRNQLRKFLSSHIDRLWVEATTQ